MAGKHRDVALPQVFLLGRDDGIEVAGVRGAPPQMVE
jgi:hypothetical protein